MELGIEGNDIDLIQQSGSKETAIIIPSSNQYASTDTINIQIKGNESTRNTHEQRKYESLEDADIGRRITQQIREENYSNKETSKFNDYKPN